MRDLSRPSYVLSPSGGYDVTRTGYYGILSIYFFVLLPIFSTSVLSVGTSSIPADEEALVFPLRVAKWPFARNLPDHFRSGRFAIDVGAML